MFKTMLQKWETGKKTILRIALCLWTFPLYAELPKPPSDSIPNGNNDWIDVGGSLVYKALHYTCIVVGVIILVGAAFGIIKAYHVAREKQELGYFFSHGAIGLVSAAVGLCMLYAAYTIIPS